MSAGDFWNKRESAQKVVDEVSRLKKKIEPLIVAEGKLADLVTLAELGEDEEPSGQSDIAAEIERELVSFLPQVDRLELAALAFGCSRCRACARACACCCSCSFFK